MPGNAYDLQFTASTTAAVVAGRRLSPSSLDVDGLHDLCEALDALSEELDDFLVAVVSGDFSARTGLYTGEEPVWELVVGRLIAQADSFEPTPMEPAAVLTEVSRPLPWDRIAALFPEGDRAALASAREGVWAVATGPLAGLHVAFGVEASLDDPTPPGLERIRGQGEGQEPPDFAVHGVRLLWCGWDGSFPAEVDLSDAAHADRVRQLGALADGAAYWLVGHYD